jgi:hypothetical protein
MADFKARFRAAIENAGFKIIEKIDDPTTTLYKGCFVRRESGVLAVRLVTSFKTDFFVKNYSRGIDWYREFFRGYAKEVPVGEIDPNYFSSEQALERIALHIPRAKIICSFRDPVERLYSSSDFEPVSPEDVEPVTKPTAEPPDPLRDAKPLAPLGYTVIHPKGLVAVNPKTGRCITWIDGKWGHWFSLPEPTRT